MQDFYIKKGRIPLHMEFSTNPDYPPPSTYCDIFGSWNEAIQLAGFVPNPASLGKIVVAKDGHKCRSFAEKLVDDWLSDHDVKHEKEVYYPNSRLRADWLVKGTYIEYLGISIRHNNRLSLSYKDTIFQKRTLCHEYGLFLIELYPNNLTNLDDLLRVFL
jgi:hypothetical protein